MITKSFSICIVLGCLIHNVFSGAYEINLNGQTFQVNVLNPDGEIYHDRTQFSDDYGELLNPQKHAICSSLRGEQCQQVTNNGEKTHNLFNYFPNHAAESVVAHANNQFNNDPSPHLWKQPMDDRTLDYLSRQNPHILGTQPITPRVHGVTQTLLNQIGLGNINGAFDSLHRVGTKKIKHRKKKKKSTLTTTSTSTSNSDQEANTKTETKQDTEGTESNEDEYDDVEIELYSNVGQNEELATALGLDEEEFGDTVDRIVSQLVASYLDNDSEEVDVSQIFATEMSVENGDVSMEELILDELSMEEINKLLNNIAEKQKKKHNDGNDKMDDGMNGEEAQIFALQFLIDTDDTMENDEESVQQETEVDNDNESEQ